MERIAESDWKVLRELRPILLERFYQRAVAEIAAKCATEAADHRQQYLDIVALVSEHDRDLSESFDDMRRSNATIRIARMCSLGLLTDSERQRFSEPTLNQIAAILDSQCA